MNLPTLNAVIYCTKAVYTEPWWHLVGEFDDFLVEDPEHAKLDVFIKFGDMSLDYDAEMELRIMDPMTGDLMERFPALIRGDKEGVATRVISVEMAFKREATYHVEVVIDGQLVGVRKLPVWFQG
ncbi:MAG: hypothetical protein M5U25_05385 [Planctomycetota bacterium]|nr:hypothetical protein [Planctomycetota bacterium]